jgi:hypothetical protein
MNIARRPPFSCFVILLFLFVSSASAVFAQNAPQ